MERSEEFLDGGLILVGPGRVGLSLAADLVAGDPGRLILVGRRSDPPPFPRDDPSGIRYIAVGETGDPTGALQKVRAGSALLFAVPDDALTDVAARWSEGLARSGHPAPAVALHTSGFHGSEALAPLAELGTSLASWHPLVALASPRPGAFRGRTVGIEGRGRAVAVAERLAGAVGARPVRLHAGQKARWHAAAVFASNALVACLSVAVREARAAAAEIELDDLLPLARSALEEIADRGLTRGLTGPVSRGDARAVSGHLHALDRRTGSLYRLLADELLRVAGPRLDDTARRALRAALEGTAVTETGEDGEREG